MLTLGSFLVSAALLVFAACTLVFRDPHAPRWTQRAWAGEVVSLGIVGVVAVGVGCLINGLITFGQGVGPLDLALPFVVLAVSVMIWRKMHVRDRLRAFEDVRRFGPAAVTPAVVPMAHKRRTVRRPSERAA